MSDLLNGAEGADKNAIESDTARESVASATAASALEEKPATSDKPEASNEALVEDLTKKAHDLDAVRKSVEDAASISGTLWISYLFTLLYIAIATGAVTHNDLLLENPVKLPFLNVELPLVAFFALAPILFIIAHAYTLMHFVMLAAKVGTYDTELRDKLSGKDADATRLGLRRQLPSNIFVQFLAGPSDIRVGGLGWLLKAVAWISLVIGPVLLLLLLQIRFVPYHLEWVTWVQRFAVLTDLILLWFLWPAVLGSRSDIRWPRLWRHPVLAFASLVPIGLAFVAARFPGESLDAQYGDKKWIRANAVTAWLGAVNDEGKPIPTSLHDLLFSGPVDNVTRRRTSLFSNTLVLQGFNALDSKKIDDQKKLDWAKHSLVLRGRHLEGGVFFGADLRKSDLDGAQLQGASLNFAQLQGASLTLAQLQGASLDGAQLQGASLDYAQLQGASLTFAQLQGASLNGAQLQGASLDGAQLQGASLTSAQLRGASLNFAQLKGESLDGAQLQGASLDYAELQGASLTSAQLQGASLNGAQLQGASFKDAALVAADLSKAEIWRANFSHAQIDKVFGDGLRETPMSKQDFVKLKDDITKSLPEDWRERVFKRIEILNPDNTAAPDHIKLYAAKADVSAYQQARAGALKNLACSGEDSAASIVHELVKQQSVATTGPFAPQLAADILACLSASNLAETDKAKLQKIEQDAAAKSPAQAGEAAPSTAQNKRQDLQQPKNHRTKK
jgi:uncharacterized protein YjbI with pentapeptide repeats